ncbi:MAG: PorP/SprF family type IX secretion system membrane protein [Chitinophagaceae bacterium]|nr:PorP/SprF family type IX secretion system membrane protein [Chitinophagaceae bacterium]
MRKLLLSLALFIVVNKQAEAQQLHFTSIFQQHNSMYNPAAAGFTGHGVIGTTYRSMWSAFPGNPKTFMVYGDAMWEKKSSGFAGYLYRDVTGPTSRTGLQAAYSYHVKTGTKSKLGLGIELRGLQYSIDKAKLTDALGSDLVLAGNNASFKLDAGAGVYYSDGKFSAGAAVSQLIQSKLAFNDVPNATERAKLYRHYNFTANYFFETGGGTHLIPHVMVRVITNAPTELDLGCKVDYQDKIWWTLSWRMRHFWSLQAGFKLLDKISLTYAYDYYNEPFSDYNTGNNAHEIGLRFDLKK